MSESTDDYRIIDRALGKLAKSSPNALMDGTAALQRIIDRAEGRAPEPPAGDETVVALHLYEAQAASLVAALARITELEDATDTAAWDIERDALNAKIARLEERGIEGMQAEIVQLRFALLEALAEGACVAAVLPEGQVPDWTGTPDATKAGWRNFVTDIYAARLAEIAAAS